MNKWNFGKRMSMPCDWTPAIHCYMMSTKSFLLSYSASTKHCCKNPIWHYRKQEYITPVLYDPHWLPIQQRIKLKVITLTFKCIYGLAPDYLSELIEPYQPTRDLQTMDTLSLKVPLNRTLHGSCSAFKHNRTKAVEPSSTQHLTDLQPRNF